MTDWARLEFPDRFRVGLDRLAELAEWQVRHDGSDVFVAAREAYRRQPPRLIRLARVVRAADAESARPYEAFGRWLPQDEWRSEDVAARVQALREIQEPASITDAFVSFRLQFMTIHDREVPAFVRDMYLPIAKAFPGSSVWSLQFSPTLRWRVAAVRMLFGAQQHPEILEQIEVSADRLPTPMGLLPSLGFGMGAFVEPALLPASPWIIGMNCTRAGGQIVILFGQSIPGFSGNQADDPLHLLRGRSPVVRTTTRPDVAPPVAEKWLEWWVERLNHVLARALNVGSFRAEGGQYDPGLHLGVLASLELLFSGVQGILADSRRPQYRVRQMFDVIDLLAGLSFGSWENLLRPDKVQRQLKELRGTLPVALHELALARCEPAIKGLEQFGADFVPRSPDGLLRVQAPTGETQLVPVSAAVHTYLRLMRNAGTHSFRKAMGDPYQRSIIAAQTGDIPDDIADLAFFQLLRFMIDPRVPQKNAIQR